MRERLVTLVTPAVWAAAVACLVGALAGWGTAQFLHVPQVDQLASFRPAATTRVLAADGELVASFALERRIEARPDQIPDTLKLAIVAIEDADFFEHGGVDPKAVLRAVVASVRTGKLGGGGGASTLTQQLARNLFLTRERKITRKLKEMLLAIDIEKRFSKDQILTMYANQIFLGHGAYGVEAASRLYFGVTASELRPAQAALLAGMIQNPNRLNNPFLNPDGATRRRDKVLRSMLDLGFIERDAYDQAVAEPLGVALHRQRADTGAYFLEMVRQKIVAELGDDALYTSGLEIRTTMRPDLQEMAEQAVRDGLVALDMSMGYRKPRNVVSEGLAETPEAYTDDSWYRLTLRPGQLVRAVVMTVDRESATLRFGEHMAHLGLEGAEWTKARSLTRLLEPGDLAMVRLPDPLVEVDGSREGALPEGPQKVEIQAGQVLEVELAQEPEIESALVAMDNRTGAILALVGGFDFHRSEFNRAVQSKLQCGSAFKPFVFLTAFQQGYTPADTVFDAPFLLPDGTGELTYCPKNYYGRYHGISTLRRALELSFNASAVKLQQLVGGDAVVETAKRFGISTELRPYPSLALGSLEVRLIDLVRAYAGFANLGEVPEPHAITQILDRDGRVKERFFPRVERVAPAPVTYLVLHVLRGVIERGTGAAARSLGANLAGKTGTTDDYTDAWFVGCSPEITVGVWVGRNLKAPIGKRMTGARAALPIWMRFMEAYLDTLDEDGRREDFPVPPGVVFTAVDWYSGKRAVPGCSRTVLEAFLDGTEPAESCEEPGTKELYDETPWPFQQPYYVPRPGEPMPDAEALAVADDRLSPDREDGTDSSAEDKPADGE